MPKRVLAIITEPGGGLNAAGREAIGLGRSVAEALGGEFDVAIFAGADSPSVAEAAERGATRVVAIDTAGQPLTSDVLVGGAAAAVQATGAEVVVVNRGGHVLDLVPRLAARSGGGCVMNVTEVRLVDGDIQAVAAIYGGAARGVYRFTAPGPRVICGAPGAAQVPEREGSRETQIMTVTAPDAGERVRVVEAARAAEGPRLEDARIVVSGGRGLKTGEKYDLIRELAAALGGMPGASRAIVDDAWAKPSEQVGLTGKIVTPQLYVAAGISGASQHMAGCSNSRTLVAINTDPQAPIFRYAHYGIVDDCLEVLPELVRLAKARMG